MPSDETDYTSAMDRLVIVELNALVAALETGRAPPNADLAGAIRRTILAQTGLLDPELA